jgi:hypothetical protein
LRGLLAGLVLFSGCAVADPIVEGLVQTARFDELTAYDVSASQLNNPGFGGFTPSFLAPLNFNTNLIPQNSIVPIATAGANASAVPEPSARTLM